MSVYIVISSDMSDEHHFLSIDRAHCDCPDETNLYVRRVRVRGGRKENVWVGDESWNLQQHFAQQSHIQQGRASPQVRKVRKHQSAW
mgnify:CR=1 FL=1